MCIRLLGFLAILILLCSKAVSGQPYWIDRRPVDPDHYIGIGSAMKTAGTSLHMEQARDQALAQIAASISVSITTETTHQILEQIGLYEEEFSAVIGTVARANLEGYELVDSWEDDNHYWVYYRLSVSDHAERLAEGKRIAAQRSHRFFESGMESIEQGRIIDALINLMQAALEIREFRGLGLPFPNNAEGFLDVEVYMQIQNILSGMKLTIHPPMVQTRLFEPPRDTVEITLLYRDHQQEQHAVPNMPLKVNPSRVNGSSAYAYHTGKNGKSILLLPTLRFERRVQFEVVPNLPVLAGIDQKEDRELLAGIGMPTGSLLLIAEPPRVYIDTRESNLDRPVDRPVSESHIRSYLTAGDWLLTDDPERADFVIIIHAATRKGIARQGVHTAFASGNVAMRKTENNDEVFSRQLQEVNGAGTSFENAGNQALERLSEKVLQVFKQLFETN